jgi:hypothetical protein
VPATVKVIAEDVISRGIVNRDLAKGISTFTHWRTTRSRVQEIVNKMAAPEHKHFSLRFRFFFLPDVNIYT